MIESILLIDDENLFHLVFEDACSLLDISLNVKSLNSADEAERYFKEILKNGDPKPECIFVDLNIIGSSFDGIELIRRINFQYGNHVIIGIISSSDEPAEQTKGKLVPTDRGKLINSFLVNNFSIIDDYGFTAKIEKEFDQIAAFTINTVAGHYWPGEA